VLWAPPAGSGAEHQLKSEAERVKAEVVHLLEQ